MATTSRGQYVIHVRNTTPLLIGWYDPVKADYLGIRLTEIKGLWNWWARAFIAGAMYDLGLLKGESSRDILLKPSSRETKIINFITGKIMGLGFAGEGESEASRFTISVEPMKPIYPKTYRDDYQRIKLLSLGERRIEGFAPRLSFRLVVSKRVSKYKFEEDTALNILLVSLLLTGIGKGGRRGLGSLDITSQNIIREKDLGGFIEKIYSNCLEIVEKFRDGHYRELPKLSLDSAKSSKEDNPPPLPCISKKIIRGIPISRILLVKGLEFKQIHNFFVRTERCRVLTGSSICRDQLRESHYAWVLGLPRELGKTRKTGYVLESKNITRRASPVIVTYHELENVFGEGAYVTILVSGDWPTRLTWIGAGRRPIEINVDNLIDAYRVAFNELSNYLAKLNASMQTIWPR